MHPHITDEKFGNVLWEDMWSSLQRISEHLTLHHPRDLPPNAVRILLIHRKVSLTFTRHTAGTATVLPRTSTNARSHLLEVPVNMHHWRHQKVPLK